MFKKWTAIFVLLAFGIMSVAAVDVSFGGNAGYMFAADEENDSPKLSGDPSSNIGKIRAKMTVNVDDYNTVFFELRNDTNKEDYFNIHQAKVTTDVSGAFGLELFDITTSFGLIDDRLTNWTQASNVHRARFVQEYWGEEDLAKAYVGLDFGLLGLEALISQGHGEEAFSTMLFALSNGKTFPVEGLDIILKYGLTNDDDSYTIAEGREADFFVTEIGYTAPIGDVNLYIPFSLTWKEDSDLTKFGIGAVADYSMFSAGAEVSFGVGDNAENNVGVLDFTAEARVSEAATLFLRSYNNIGDPTFADYETDDKYDSFFQSIDLGASYSIGATTFYAGGVIAKEDYTTTQVCNDDSEGRYGVYGSGFYFAARVSF